MQQGAQPRQLQRMQPSQGVELCDPNTETATEASLKDMEG